MNKLAQTAEDDLSQCSTIAQIGIAVRHLSNTPENVATNSESLGLIQSPAIGELQVRIYNQIDDQEQARDLILVRLAPASIDDCIEKNG